MSRLTLMGQESALAALERMNPAPEKLARGLEGAEGGLGFLIYAAMRALEPAFGDGRLPMARWGNARVACFKEDGVGSAIWFFDMPEQAGPAIWKCVEPSGGVLSRALLAEVSGRPGALVDMVDFFVNDPLSAQHLQEMASPGFIERQLAIDERRRLDRSLPRSALKGAALGI